jgi:hypothetical protein
MRGINVLLKEAQGSLFSPSTMLGEDTTPQKQNLQHLILDFPAFRIVQKISIVCKATLL